jgi:hypothetical protein
VFNEYGVQIMTPAYEGDPAEPKVVPVFANDAALRRPALMAWTPPGSSAASLP